MTEPTLSIDAVPGTSTAYVRLSTQPSAGELVLDPDVRASIDSAGRLVGLDIADTTRFGSPFDEAAASRATDWARSRMREQIADS